MRFNGRGELAGGLGVLSLDGQPLGPGNFLCWADDDTLLANAPGPDGVFRLYAYRRAAGWAPGLLDPRGATKGAGGAGNWAISLATQPNATIYGVWQGDGLPAAVKGYYPLDGAPDGRLAFYTPDFARLAVLHPDGTVTEVAVGPNVSPGEVRLVPDGLVWQDAGKPRTVSRLTDGASAPDVLPTLDAAFTAYSFDAAGRRWLFYHNELTYLHPVGETWGYSFPPSYGPDVYVAGEWATVALCANAGETPDAINILPAFQLGDGMTDLTLLAPAEVPAIDRPLWLGWFEFAGETDAPHSCRIPVPANVEDRPLGTYVETLDGRRLLHYVAAPDETNVDDLDAWCRMARAFDTSTPVYAYWTYQAQQVRPPRDADVVGVEAYRKVWETAEAFEARVRESVARAGRCRLIAQCYTSNATNTADLRSVVPAYAQIARDCQAIDGIDVFSGSGRATGWQDHPDVWDLWRALAAGIRGTPPVVIVNPPHPEPPPVPPDPPPQPVEVPMIIGPMREAAPVPSFTNVTEVPHPDGQGLVALKTAAGKFKSLRPEGTWQADADQAGAFERFLPAGGIYLAYRGDWPGAERVVWYFGRLEKAVPYLNV